MELLERVRPPEWQDDAACLDKPQEWFFGSDNADGKKRHRPILTQPEVRRAKEVCADCMVKQECYDYAIETKQAFGIWGGTTGRERRRIWREQ